MRFVTNSVCSVLSILLIVYLSHLPQSYAKPTSGISELPEVNTRIISKASSNSSDIINSTSTTEGSTNEARSSSVQSATLSTDPRSVTLPAEDPTETSRLVRRKRESEVVLPFDFHTMHMPCDMDQKGIVRIIDSFPNHCIWVWNNRYVNEGFYRVYKTYQLEAFFFGQYHERLKRYEIDPHSWDYTDTRI